MHFFFFKAGYSNLSWSKIESGEFAPPTNLWKNDWVNLQIIWKEGIINKVLSRKLITSPGAAYFSTKKNRNVKEPLLSSHTIPVWETASTPFVGHPSKKIPNCPKVLPEPPMIAFKQPNSLRNLLVRVEISKPSTTMGKSHSCGDKRCKRS